MLYKLMLIILILDISSLAAQQQQITSTNSNRSKYNFTKPLDIEMLLSGNYGEIRSNHFHSGIDIKTQGVIGKPVYAMESGYVSSIMVSPYGFGKEIYVTHPNGTITIYGYVERFNIEIDTYVYEMQYQRKSFAVDIYSGQDKFAVKKGNIIAYSGNRGSSEGPHLHVEVRDVGATNPLVIYSIELNVDHKNIFNILIDNISFAHARYAYAASLYPESKGKSNAIYRLHKLPNNPLF